MVANIVVLSIIAVLIALNIWRWVHNSKKGISSCGGDCGSCGTCNTCTLDEKKISEAVRSEAERQKNPANG